MPKGVVYEVLTDQDGNKVTEEDEDSEIIEQAKYLKKLDQYPQDILRLQHKKE